MCSKQFFCTLGTILGAAGPRKSKEVQFILMLIKQTLAFIISCQTETREHYPQQLFAYSSLAPTHFLIKHFSKILYRSAPLVNTYKALISGQKVKGFHK